MLISVPLKNNVLLESVSDISRAHVWCNLRSSWRDVTQQTVESTALIRTLTTKRDRRNISQENLLISKDFIISITNMVKKLRVSNHTTEMNDELGLTEILQRTNRFLKEESFRRRCHPFQTRQNYMMYKPSPLLLKWGLYFYLHRELENSKPAIHVSPSTKTKETVVKSKKKKNTNKRRKKHRNKTKAEDNPEHL